MPYLYIIMCPFFKGLNKRLNLNIMARHLIHAHSSVITDDLKPKLPVSERIKYGELAVNFAKDYETISLKNSDDEIVTFSSDKIFNKRLDDSEYVTSAALNDLNTRINEIDGDISVINNDITENTQKISQVNNNITTINNDITDINNNITDITDDITEINTSITQMNNVIADKIDTTVSITYSDLKTMKNNSELQPGQFYRITDYVTTTTQTDTQSANHAFDIVVMATDTNTFNENAMAVKHSGDTYFSDSNLNAWVIKYTFDNDSSKYAWADTTNGKGVIYYMKDENNNECPYDFKNIKFKRNATSLTTYGISIAEGYYFTFDNNGTDISNRLDVHSNTMGVANVVDDINATGGVTADYKQQLNNNVFIGYPCYCNKFGGNCTDNTFVGGKCYNNTFGSDCKGNIAAQEIVNNTFGNACSSNTLGQIFKNNVFGNACSSNKCVGTFTSNNLGNNCVSNEFGNVCSDNTFYNSCHHNILPEWCGDNLFQNDVHHITFAKNYTFSVLIESGNTYITLTTPATTAQNTHLRGIRIAQNVNPTKKQESDRITISHPDTNDSKLTTYQKTGSGVVDL